MCGTCRCSTTAKRYAPLHVSARQKKKSSKKRARPSPNSRPNPDISNERQLVRRNEGRPRPWHLDPHDFHATGVIDVIEVENREYTRVGPPPSQVVLQVDAVEFFAQQRCGQSPRPFIEITEHEFRAVDVPIGDDGCE